MALPIAVLAIAVTREGVSERSDTSPWLGQTRIINDYEIPTLDVTHQIRDDSASAQ